MNRILLLLLLLLLFFPTCFRRAFWTDNFIRPISHIFLVVSSISYDALMVAAIWGTKINYDVTKSFPNTSRPRRVKI